MTLELNGMQNIRDINWKGISIAGIIGAGGAVGAYCAGDWLGKRIYRITHQSLLTILPRWVSHRLHDVIGDRIAVVSEWSERQINPFVARVIVTPLLEEFIFRGGQMFFNYYISNYLTDKTLIFLSCYSSAVLWAFIFSYCHNSGQPGRDMGLFFTGIVFGTLVNLQPGFTGFLSAMVAHSFFNMNPITPTLKVVRKVEK